MILSIGIVLGLSILVLIAYDLLAALVNNYNPYPLEEE